MKKLLLLFFVLLFSKLSYAADIVIKSTTESDDIHVGDYWITEDLVEGFINNNKNVEIDFRNEHHKKHDNEPEINIFMRGYTQILPPYPDGYNVLYAYYPMAYYKKSGQKINKNILNKRRLMPKNSALDDEWQNYDIILVASSSYSQQLNKEGIAAHYVPQFTNPKKFFEEPSDELKSDILFVGSNWHDRTSLRYAIESGFFVDVYGFNWSGIIPQNMYKGSYIANEDLHKYYSSAKIVLNDHRPDMKDFGFINNRIYDATACGALVISDYMPEIEEAYGNSVPMYRNKEELAALLDYYLTHDDERIILAKKAQEITLIHFTNDIVAKTILEIVHNVKENN